MVPRLAKDIAQPVLVVDLDGTLLRSDMLHESFWSAAGEGLVSPAPLLAALRRGRAALKRHLAQAVTIDPALLPYDPEVVEYVRRWRDGGGRTALVTATDGALAASVAGHLGLFDEVHGSDGLRNLKGAEKAAFLADRYAGGGYAYMGDAEADLPVWRSALRAITVNASSGLRRRADALGCETEHLTTAPRALRPYMKALRPHQWSKNVLVFVPILAAHDLDALTFLQGLMAFLAFSLVASSVYVVNDLLDLAADRAHPRKRLRPFASGSLPLAHGIWMAGGLLAGGALVAAGLGVDFLLVMLVYLAATTAYSLHLKRRIVVDICVLAGLYTLRIMAGAAATGIPISVWLLAFSIFFFLSLAAVKRQAELVDAAGRGALGASGRGYHVGDLPVVSQIAIAAGFVSVLVMALYLNSPDVLELYASPEWLWGICLILLYWTGRVTMMAHRGEMHDDPIVFAFRDRVSRVCGVLVLFFAAGGAVT